MHFKMSSAICFNFDRSKILSSGYGLTNHSQGHPLYFSHRFFVFRFECITTSGLANQKLCYIQMLLNIKKNLKNKTENVLKNGW